MRSLWAGRTAAVVAILLIALNLRTAVASVSPIISLVSGDIPLDTIGIGVLGTLPPIAFAASGLLAPLVTRRVGLETTFVLACAAMIVGQIVRAVGLDYWSLLAGSAVALAGMGFANILLPPAVKKYFPDRIGQVTAAYATLLAISIAVPPLVASPVAAAVGWRVSIGGWAIVAVAALVPWLVVRAQSARLATREREDNIVPTPRPELLGGMRRSRTAVAIAISFSSTAINTYAFFAWLPELLRQRAGSSAAEAGALLFVFGIVGLPLGFIAPILAVRVRNVGVVIAAGVAFFLVGYLGLILVPTLATWLWVLLAGIGAINFPLCLALIGLRTRGPAGAVAVSGFAQAIGYSFGALGPLLFGILHDLTGGWVAPLLFLAAVSLVALIPAVLLAKPGYVEDELASVAPSASPGRSVRR